MSHFKQLSNAIPRNPVILMYDNEIESGKGKPLGEFLNYAKINSEKKEMLKDKCMVGVIDNLYLLTVPLIDEKPECDIEDLFDNLTRSHKIDGKKFTKDNNFDTRKYYGKEIFSQYVMDNYADINFDEFRPVLDNISSIINIYTKLPVDIDKSSASKVLLETQ